MGEKRKHEEAQKQSLQHRPTIPEQIQINHLGAKGKSRFHQRAI